MLGDNGIAQALFDSHSYSNLLEKEFYEIEKNSTPFRHQKALPCYSLDAFSSVLAWVGTHDLKPIPKITISVVLMPYPYGGELWVSLNHPKCWVQV